jgi:tetratricopeptide (TPR) repeat protein
VIAILRDVTRALGYAHARGVVHRDIKPDNVLLAGGAAIVTDFGIGKALAVARSGIGLDGHVVDPTAGALTSVGLALGTLAYMAPEQAAGDPASDQRADFYSFGTMAYEMLAGALPFAGRATSGLMLAKMSESPRAITEVRNETPSALAALVMRCLERDPAHRPQSANEIAAALETLVSNPLTNSGTATTTPTSQRGRWMIAAAALVLVAAGTAFVLNARGVGPFGTRDAAAAASRSRVLVGEFNAGPDSSLGASVTELFRVALAQSRTISVADPTSLGLALQRMQRAPGTRVEGSVARELALREGMPVLVEGRLLDAGGHYQLTAKLVAARDGEVFASLDEPATNKQDVIAAVGRLSNKVRARLGESASTIRDAPPLERVSTVSLDALRKYTAALNVDRLQQVEAANGLLREAIALDTTFAMAYRKLGNNLYWTRDRAEAIGYLRRAYALRDRLTEIERNVMLGTYYSKVDRDLPRAMGAFEAVLAADPDNIIALDNIAYNLRITGSPVRAESLYQRLSMLSPTAFYVTQLGYVRDLLERFPAADSTYRAAVAVSKRGEFLAPYWMGTYHFGSALQHDSAEAYIRKAVDWPGIGPANRSNALAGAVWVTRARGRLAESERLLRDRMAIDRNRNNPGAAQAMELDLVRATAWLRGDRAAALRQLESIRQRMSTLPLLDRRGDQLATAFARLGQHAIARQIVADLARSGDTSTTIDLSRDSELAAMIMNSEGRRAEALAMLNRLNADCENCYDAEIGFMFDAAGQPDSAIMHLERYVSSHRVERLQVDSWFLAPTYKRLAELYEDKGDLQKSATNAVKLIDLWKNADPDVQKYVEEARRRARRVEGRPLPNL